MTPITTLLLVALVIVLWVGVVASIWALVSAPEERPPEVSQTPTNE